MVRRWLYVIPVVGGLLVYVVSQSVTGTGGDLGPQGTPAPGLGVKPTDESRGDEGSFSLSEPIPTTIVHEIAGKAFEIPEGSTMVLVGEGVPIVDEKTGELISDVPEHASFWLIRRGKTEVKIDADTGEVFDDAIDPADRDAFSQITDGSD